MVIDDKEQGNKLGKPLKTSNNSNDLYVITNVFFSFLCYVGQQR